MMGRAPFLGFLILAAHANCAVAAVITDPGVPGRTRVQATPSESVSEVRALRDLAAAPEAIDADRALAEFSTAFPGVDSRPRADMSLKNASALEKVLPEATSVPVAIERSVLKRALVIDHYVPAMGQVPVYREELVRESVKPTVETSSEGN